MVTLDRTAFYPTSGGQPHDLGKLGDVPVIEVADAENDKVVHYMPREVPSGPVHGEIDWARRIDHMQQHTGQHLLSAAFIELFNFPTVSFHLGRQVSTIDLDAPSVLPRHLEEAERRTNEIIFDDRVVSVRFGTSEELSAAGIRKKVAREGILRAIEIEGFDRQPCGGTHLERTGQAGLLLVRKLERRHGWRVEFVCGFRALAAARGDFSTLTHSASLLSCGLPEVPVAVARTIEERRTSQSAEKRLEARLAEHESRSLLAAHAAREGALASGARVIIATLAEATPSYLSLLAAKLVAGGEVVALLASRSSGSIVFAQTKGSSRDMGALLRETLKEFDGKGGGAKDFAQASLEDPARVESLLAGAESRLV
jgi:alanyl-tRNA synthetase